MENLLLGRDVILPHPDLARMNMINYEDLKGRLASAKVAPVDALCPLQFQIAKCLQ
jgi:hypothetical protein